MQCFVGVLIAGIMIAPASPAGATDLPLVGDISETPFRDECPAGKYMVGLKGRVSIPQYSGGWIDQITLVCAAIRPDGGTTDRSQSRFFWGGEGGSAVDGECRGAAFVTRVKLWTAGMYGSIRFMEISCLSLLNRRGTLAAINSGGLKPTEPVEQSCPAGEMASGIQGRYAKNLRAFGLICKKLEVPQAEAPVSFFGAWSTRTDQGGEFDLVLLPNGGNNVTGTFTHTQGNADYNGSVTGTVNGLELNLTYDQPTISATGRCTLTLASDGRSYVGHCRTGDTQQTEFIWSGRVQKSFSGVWDTHTNVGGRYQLVLQMTGFTIIGTFTELNGNPQYNGTLLGDVSADKKSFNYRYSQKNGSHGSGSFNLSDDGQSLTGTVTPDNDNTIYTWEGTKK